ncbi:glycosyltransferase family 2 protein [Blautia argi]|uniref:glycosyltransferase family 2 protein n=2 Tax=Blautia argi TaxID=1912897 RepID=UPI0026730DD5|nr:glycosyltransferase family 2 protein [Blautia argi]
MQYKSCIDVIKYRIKPDESYIRVNGWAFEKNGQPFELITEINGKVVANRLKKIKRPDVVKKFKHFAVDKMCGFHIKVYVDPEETIEEFQFYIQAEGKKKLIKKLEKQEILDIVDRSSISHNIDQYYIDKEHIVVSGWTFSNIENMSVKYKVFDSDEKEIKFTAQILNRPDLVEAGFASKENSRCGFHLEFPYERGKTYKLRLSDGINAINIHLFPEKLMRRQKVKSTIGFARQGIKKTNPRTIKKVFHYMRENGVRGLKAYIIQGVNRREKPYAEWFAENMPSEEELEQQKTKIFEKQPKISIIVPTYKTPEVFLREMLDSVVNQTYANWELCVADGSEGDKTVEEILDNYAKKDKRIRYCILDKNLGIADNTNAALQMATGDYIGLFDHDDLLAPNALYEIVAALQEENYDILYTDEDKITGDGKEHNDPNFKPDFSMDLFRSHNYITHFFVVKHSIMKKIGGFRSEYDGSQDYDLMFRCIENSEKIKHIPMILYHWRIHQNSVAGDPASKMYAYDAGKKAIEAHLKRMHISATVEHQGLWGMYHVKYDTPGNPMISIVIPNKDHVEDLDTCIRSIQSKSSYRNFEFVIVENNSTEKETFAYYESIQKEFDNVRVVTWKGIFNYSAINNFGVNYTNGEYLLFLNNDTEMISEDALKEMLGCCMREEVGAVGAKLLYEDDTVQHAGVVVGFGGYAGHVNTGIGRDDYGYMVRAVINCNYSAVTAACMMTRKSLFLEAGGFDEQFVVACNDVDYCLQLGKMNKLIVYNAYAEWYHYESKSRGYEDTPEKLARFESEVNKFQKKWPEILEKGDPYYNPNFPVTQAPFTLGEKTK